MMEIFHFKHTANRFSSVDFICFNVLYIDV